jgi:hypothetical protein
MDLRNAEDLYVPYSNSDQVKKLPIIAFAKNWNSLSENKNHRNPVLFKNLLKEEIWNNI